MQTIKFYKVKRGPEGELLELVVASVNCVQLTFDQMRDPAFRNSITVNRADDVMHKLGWKRRRNLTPAEQRLIAAGGLKGEKSIKRLQARLQMDPV